MRTRTCTVWILAAATAACSGGEPTSPVGMGRVTFQIATAPLGASAAPAAADVVVARGSDVVVISQVQIVARKIRLRMEDAACEDDFEDEDDAPVPSPEADDDQGEAEDDDAEAERECPTLKLGPLLLEPPLLEGPVTSFTADVPVGTYTHLRLQIHKPRGSKDQAFLAAHPDFADISIRVTGTFNGDPFSFDTGITEEEEILLSTPVVVTTAGSTSFTLLLDVRGWFLDQSGNALVDPRLLSSSIRSLIEHNIRHSFRAFRDDDHDGEDDEHDD